MDVKEAIHKRRAYRSLDPVKITEDLIEDLAECAQLAASCFNSAINSARKTGAGGVVSVSAPAVEVAALAQQVASASSREFRFVEPSVGRSSELLISESHRMWLDYARPSVQI